MQSVSSRIWTRVAVYISYDDNHYTTGIGKHSTYLTYVYISLKALAIFGTSLDSCEFRYILLTMNVGQIS